MTDLIHERNMTSLIYFWTRSILSGFVSVKVLFRGDSLFSPPVFPYCSDIIQRREEKKIREEKRREEKKIREIKITCG